MMAASPAGVACGNGIPGGSAVARAALPLYNPRKSEKGELPGMNHSTYTSHNTHKSAAAAEHDESTMILC